MKLRNGQEVAKPDSIDAHLHDAALQLTDEMVQKRNPPDDGRRLEIPQPASPIITNYSHKPHHFASTRIKAGRSLPVSIRVWSHSSDVIYINCCVVAGRVSYAAASTGQSCLSTGKWQKIVVQIPLVEIAALSPAGDEPHR